MKIIKYRVYDKEKKQMSYAPVSMNFSADGHINGVALFTNGFTTSVIGKDGMEWIQFTGLKDKNGKEIYEGDILFRKGGFGKKQFVVTWNDEECGFCCGDDSTTSIRYATKMNPIPYYVIGNIYENPELLTPTNKE